MARQIWSQATQWQAPEPTNGDYADLNMGQAEAVLGANNAPDFSAGISISDSAQEIVDHSHVITSSGIAPNAVHATGVSVTEAVQILDDETGSIGEFAGSFDLDQAIVEDTSLTLHSIKEGRAVLSANNAPDIDGISFSLDAADVVSGAPGVLAPELTGEFAAAGFVEVTNVISLEAVELLHVSEAVDEYVLGEGFVVPPVGVPVSVAAAIFGAVNEGAATNTECSVYIPGHGARV